MIKLLFGETNYNIPTNYDEITWVQYVGVIERMQRPIVKRISHITNIPEKDLDKLPIVEFGKLIDIVSFIDVPGVVQHYEKVIDVVINIGAESYGKLEEARQKITQAKEQICAGADVWKIYMGEDISNHPLKDAIVKVNFIYGLINKFLAQYEDLYKRKATAEEEVAGVDMFRMFGVFPTLDMLVKEWGGALRVEKGESPHDAVLKIASQIVMTKLLFDLKKSDYEEKLHKLRAV